MPGPRVKISIWVWAAAVGALSLAACANAGTGAVSAPSASSGAESTADSKPRPNADLAAELVRYYPLRGFVLSEGGSARVRFTVAASGTVKTGETISSTREEYAQACRQMLRASTWTPARRAGRAVEFSSVFDCRFEHGAELAARGTVGTQAVIPPEPPDYGKAWYERYGEDFVTHDTSAQLRIAVDPHGAVRVIGAEPGSDPAVVQACREMLQQGPAWTPAKDATGRAIASEVVFSCRVELRARRKELHVNAVSSLGRWIWRNRYRDCTGSRSRSRPRARSGGSSGSSARTPTKRSTAASSVQSAECVLILHPSARSPTRSSTSVV
jgi:hypothetical protein